MNNMKRVAIAWAIAFTLGANIFSVSVEAATHTVEPGETLWGISQKYNIPVEQIMQDNDLESYLIFPDDELEIKEQDKNEDVARENIYNIAPGDTLIEISKKFSITIEDLVAWNNIASADYIFVDDVIALNEASKHLAKVTMLPVVQTKTKKPEPKAQTQSKSKTSQAVSAQVQTAQASPDNDAKTITMTATAYTAYCKGCSGITANGTNLRANPGLKVIAVDPRVIPLGTKVWVEGYGTAIAADTGGAIKGNKIDVFIPTQEGALSWGRKTVRVQILD